MDQMWCCAAVLVIQGKVVDVPTFYLNGRTQGIVDEEHAMRIARTVVDPGNVADRVSISAIASSGVFSV